MSPSKCQFSFPPIPKRSGAATEAAAAALRRALAAKNMTDLPGALLPDHAGTPVEATPGTGTTHGNLRAALAADGTLSFSRADTGDLLFTASASFAAPDAPAGAGYLAASLAVVAGDKSEVVYGLGQGNWTPEGGCPAPGLRGARIVPLEPQ